MPVCTGRKGICDAEALITFSPLCLHPWGFSEGKRRSRLRRHGVFEEEAVTSGVVCVFGGQVATSGSPSLTTGRVVTPNMHSDGLRSAGSRWSARKRRKEKTVIFTETTLHMQQKEDLSSWLQTWMGSCDSSFPALLTFRVSYAYPETTDLHNQHVMKLLCSK